LQTRAATGTAASGRARAIAIGLALPVLLTASVMALAGEEPSQSVPLLSAPPAAAPLGPPRSAEADAAAYESCMTLARAKPEAGRKQAQEWEERGGGHPAEHCFAVALIGLRQYKDAAGRLESLGQSMVRAPESLRAEVFDQAWQAWMLAGNPARAYEAAGLALRLRPDDPDLLLDRAEAAGAAGWYDKAAADLDRVLAANPSRVEALIYRAAANRALARLDPALDDITEALKRAPDSIPALLERGNIRALRGDIEGARLDWERVATMSPGSPEAVAAKKNLERGS
jgi:tetratricopeptide (TPR) repeat protein